MLHKLVTPPAVEPFGIEVAKEYLRVTHEHEDATITAHIGAARLLCENAARMSFVTQERQATFTLPQVRSLGFDLGGSVDDVDDINSGARLYRPPVASIDSVTLTKGTAADLVVPADLYEVDENSGLLSWETGFSDLLGDYRKLVVSYTAGLAVESFVARFPDIVEAIKMTMAVLYEFKGLSDDAIPPGAKQILGKYWRPA